MEIKANASSAKSIIEQGAKELADVLGQKKFKVKNPSMMHKRKPPMQSKK